MFISAVMDPDALAGNCSWTTSYRDQAVEFLKGIKANGVIIVDKEEVLIEQLSLSIKDLPIKFGQQVNIIWEEILKNKHSRMVISSYSFDEDGLTVASIWRLAEMTRAEAVVTSDTHKDILLKSKSDERVNPIALGEYLGSSLDNRRRWYMEEVPPIDQLTVFEADNLIGKAIMYSRSLSFFDQYIAHDIPKYRLGIKRILDLWLKHGLFAQCPEASVELITCRPGHMTMTEARSSVMEKLVKPLASQFPFAIRALLRHNHAPHGHPRHLQTDNGILLFDRGFDLCVSSHSIKYKRCIVKLDNGSAKHLSELRAEASEVVEVQVREVASST